MSYSEKINLKNTICITDSHT